MNSFDDLQVGLEAAWSAGHAGDNVEHVVVWLPSMSLPAPVHRHYAHRIPALEHRYLLSMLMLDELEGCELVFLCSTAPDAAVLDYYTALASAGRSGRSRSRLRIVPVPGTRAKSLAANLLDHPQLIAEIRDSFAGRPVYVEPWNVTECEMAVAMALGAPINGTSPELWPLAYKSASRRLFTRLGVPVAAGRGDVSSVDEAVDAVVTLRAEVRFLRSVVIKLDNCASGEGNAIIPVDGRHGRGSASGIRKRIEGLPQWYLDEMRHGCVVEALIDGSTVSSPSVQVDILPSGEVVVLATHEQVLTGEHHQVYAGCRFPANPSYAPQLATYGQAVGEELARHGALGRLGIDFMARQDLSGNWSTYALEVNLRKGGTTAPFMALQHLVPGHYDTVSARWSMRDGGSRSYCSTDNLVNDAWLGLPPAEVIGVLRGAGLQFDRHTATGIVLHMLEGLSIDGRFGMTAIGLTPDHAAGLFEIAAATIGRSFDGRRPVTASRARS